METLGIPELTGEPTEELCTIAEEAARAYVNSKVPAKEIEKLDITTEIEGPKPTTLTVDIELIVSPLMKKVNLQKIVNEATKESFTSAEKYLRQVSCHSRK